MAAAHGVFQSAFFPALQAMLRERGTARVRPTGLEHRIAGCQSHPRRADALTLVLLDTNTYLRLATNQTVARCEVRAEGLRAHVLKDVEDEVRRSRTLRRTTDA